VLNRSAALDITRLPTSDSAGDRVAAAGGWPFRERATRRSRPRCDQLLLTFALAAATSLATSALLVARLERVGERLRAPEALLGLLAALAADAPEITSAAAAITAGRAAVGLGVTLGSNVFNLACSGRSSSSRSRLACSASW